MKNLILLFLLWSLWYLAFATRTIVAPILPLIETELAINHTKAGGLYLFSGLGATVACLLAGHLTVSIGIKRLVVISFLLTAGAAAGIFYAHGYFMLATMLFILGLGGGFYLPCAVPLITTVFEPNHWGKVISVHETAAGFSILSVPIVVAFGLGFVEWRFLFLFFAATVSAATMAFWFLAPDPQPGKINSPALRTILKRTDFWVVLILWVNCSMTSMGVYNIVPLYLVDEKSMQIDFANHLFGMSRIGGVIGQILIGFFLDRFSTRKIIFLLVLGSGLSTLGMALVQSQWLFISLLLLQGTFSVVFFPVGILAISQIAEVHERSVYTGTIMAVSQIVGIGATPFLLGAIADIWSFQLGLVFLGCLTMCLCPIIQFLRKI